MNHSLKSWPDYFKLMMDGEKDFEIRNNDRNYQINDVCQFFEWDDKRGGFTGNRSPYFRVRYVLSKTPGLLPGYVLLLLDGPWGGNPPKETLK